MGFVNNNETESFNGSVNIINNMDHIIKNEAINDEFDDNDNGDVMEETYIFSNRYINNNNGQFTASNFSLNTVQMADIVITDNIIRARSNISSSSSSSSSLSSLGSSGSSTSNRLNINGSNASNASNISLTSSKMQLLIELMDNTPQFSLSNGNDYILISSFMIATFNVFIEYFPYKHIMSEILFPF